MACSPVSLLNLAISREGYRIEKDVSYGPNARQKMDLYVPDGAAGNTPVMVFFYDGSWDSGTKSLYLALGQAFASKGIMVAAAGARVRRVFQGLDDQVITFRHRVHGDAAAVLFRLAPGAQDQPGAGAVQPRQARTVDGNVGGIFQIQLLQFIVQAHGIAGHPCAIQRKAKGLAALLGAISPITGGGDGLRIHAKVPNGAG